MGQFRLVKCPPIKIERVVRRLLFNVRQQEDQPAEVVRTADRRMRTGIEAAVQRIDRYAHVTRGRQGLLRRKEALRREAKLFHIVGALDLSGCLPSHLNGRQQKGDQDANDREDDRQLNQCETGCVRNGPASISGYHLSFL